MVVGLSGDQSRFMRLDPFSGEVSEQMPVPRYIDAFALSPDRKAFYISAFGEESERELIALDAVTLDILWRETADAIEARAGDTVQVFAKSSLHVTGDGHRLAVDGRAERFGAFLIEIDSQNPIGFAGPFSTDIGDVAFAAGESAADDLLVVGSRDENDMIVRFDGQTLEESDALRLTRSDTTFGWTRLKQIVPAPGGDEVFVLALDSVFRVGVAPLRRLDAVPRPHTAPRARLAISPAGDRLYLTDPGDGRNHPGSGILFTWGPELEPRDAVDLSDRTIEGFPPSIKEITVSSETGNVYLLAGTAKRGPLFPVQPPHIFTVHPNWDRVVGEISLESFGTGPLFVP